MAEEGGKWFDQYTTERNTLLKLASGAHAMGIAEREVKLAEELGQTLILLLDRIALDLPQKYRATLRRSFQHHLTELTTGEDVS